MKTTSKIASTATATGYTKEASALIVSSAARKLIQEHTAVCSVIKNGEFLLIDSAAPTVAKRQVKVIEPKFKSYKMLNMSNGLKIIEPINATINPITKRGNQYSIPTYIPAKPNSIIASPILSDFCHFMATH